MPPFLRWISAVRYSYYPEHGVREVAENSASARFPPTSSISTLTISRNNRPFTVDPERFPLSRK